MISRAIAFAIPRFYDFTEVFASHGASNGEIEGAIQSGEPLGFQLAPNETLEKRSGPQPLNRAAHSFKMPSHARAR
jgi:hypothetical protein